MTPRVSTRHRLAVSTTVVVILAIIIVAAIGGIGVALISVNHTSTTTNSLQGFPGYPSTLPTPNRDVLIDGSSLLYIAQLAWFANFTAHYPNVKINIGASGSGVGQSEVESGVIDIGDSDAYLTNQSQAQYPWLLDIPLAVSAQQINYNVPGIPYSDHLNFSGPILSGIYNGSIGKWNDPRLAALQSPSVAALLPDQAIYPLHRADSSGDTFIFTQYLSDTTPWWSSSVGYGLTVDWPTNPYAQGESGNAGMVSGLEETPYSIAYVGVSFFTQAKSVGAGYGYLENRAGNFVNVSQTNIQADVSAFVSSVPADERISMIYGPGVNAYPIVNFEYAIVAKNQTNADVTQVIKTYLAWCMDPNYGNSPHFLNYVNFVALPPSVYQLSKNQLAEISVT